MSTKLEYLTFVVAFLAFLERNVNRVCWHLYSVVRTRVPSICAPLQAKLEINLAAAYSTLRCWLCDKGDAVLAALDTKLGELSTWTGAHLKTCTTYERFTAVREFWSAIAARIAETWRNHGIIVGTVVVILAVFYTFLDILTRIWHTPVVQAFVETVNTSPPVKVMKTYYEGNVQPLITQLAITVKATAKQTVAALSGPVETVRESISCAIDTVVGTVYYAKFYDGVTTATNKLTMIESYQKLASKAEPYVSPVWEKISHSGFYANLVDKFTPIKEE